MLDRAEGIEISGWLGFGCGLWLAPDWKSGVNLYGKKFQRTKPFTLKGKGWIGFI